MQLTTLAEFMTESNREAITSINRFGHCATADLRDYCCSAQRLPSEPDSQALCWFSGPLAGPAAIRDRSNEIRHTSGQ